MKFLKKINTDSNENQKEEIERLQKNEQIATAVITESSAEIERLQSMNQAKLDTIHDLMAEVENLKKFCNDFSETLSNNCKKADLEKVEAVDKAKSEAIREFAERVNPVIDEMVDIMFDGNESKCRIKNCHKHSSIPCDSPTCIEENKAYWKLKIYNLVKKMVGEEK